jgi:phosphonate transport system ATP-binding protein
LGLKAGELVFDGLPSEIDARRFKEVYGEEAVEVEIA